MRMTAQDRFRATVEHRAHGEFLYYCSFTPPLEETLLAHFGLNEIGELHRRFATPLPVHVGAKRVKTPAVEQYLEFYADFDAPAGVDISDHINANGVLMIPGSMYHFTHKISPLRNATTLAKVERFPFPAPDDFTYDHMREQVDVAHAAGNFVKGNVGHLYEDSWGIRGYEPFLMDMIANPEICEYVLDRIFDRNMAFACASAEAGVDILHTGDDVANQNTLMFSRDTWRHFIKARWAKTYEAAREINPNIEIWYHSDGNITDIIDELVDIGVTVLNPVQPECMDLRELKKRYGTELVFDGTIGTQSTMPFGDASEVRRVVAERKESLGFDGGLILSPTHVLEPEVPPENVEAFLSACAGM
jgi:uroporphyrinogen decarboxylase